MKLKLRIDLQDGAPVQEVTTNMACICEWERAENRKISDGKGLGYSDLVFWAHYMLKLGGEKLPLTSREWVKQNPNMTIEAVDETDPNRTG